MIEIDRNKGILSDLDGTLIDTSDAKNILFSRAKENAEATSGAKAPFEHYVLGGSMITLVKCWASIEGLSDSEQEQRREFLRIFVKFWNDQQDQLYRVRSRLKPYTDAEKLLKKTNGSVVGLVSAKPETRIQTALTTLNWSHYFDFYIGSDSSGIQQKKPAPDMYQVASQKIGKPIDDCCILEDSLPGLISAVSAGAKFVFLVDRSNQRHNEGPLKSFIAEHSGKVSVISTLDQIQIAA